MAFQQSGLTMTFFARDYTQLNVGALSYIWFDMIGLLGIFLALGGLIFLFRKARERQPVWPAGRPSSCSAPWPPGGTPVIPPSTSSSPSASSISTRFSSFS